MTIEHIQTNLLKEHPDNPRLIHTTKFRDLCESLRRNPDYFEARPILAAPKKCDDCGERLNGGNCVAAGTHDDASFVIFAGTMRWRAAQEIGMGYVPCVIMDISDERQREIMIRDNQSSGEWDVQKLVLFGEPLLINAGFTKVELHDSFALFRDAAEDDFDEQGTHDLITEPKTKLGDVIELGRHRLYCGDATDTRYESLMRGSSNLPDEHADMIWTDPPYNIAYRNAEGVTIENDNMAPDAFERFLEQAFVNMNAWSAPNATIYVCHATKNIEQFLRAFRKAGWHWSQNLTWLKPRISGGWSQEYLHCAEPIMYGWKEGHDHYTNPSLKNTREVYDLEDLDFMERLDVWKVARESLSETEHITPKPIKLLEIPLRKSMPPHGIVLDPFAGGGSTLIAAEQMGATARLIEIDPKWCDVIRARWERYVESHHDAGKSQVDKAE